MEPFKKTRKININSEESQKFSIIDIKNKQILKKQMTSYSDTEPIKTSLEIEQELKSKTKQANSLNIAQEKSIKILQQALIEPPKENKKDAIELGTLTVEGKKINFFIEKVTEANVVKSTLQLLEHLNENRTEKLTFTEFVDLAEKLVKKNSTVNGISDTGNLKKNTELLFKAIKENVDKKSLSVNFNDGIPLKQNKELDFQLDQIASKSQTSLTDDISNQNIKGQINIDLTKEQFVKNQLSSDFIPTENLKRTTTGEQINNAENTKSNTVINQEPDLSFKFSSLSEENLLPENAKKSKIFSEDIYKNNAKKTTVTDQNTNPEKLKIDIDAENVTNQTNLKKELEFDSSKEDQVRQDIKIKRILETFSKAPIGSLIILNNLIPFSTAFMPSPPIFNKNASETDKIQASLNAIALAPSRRGLGDINIYFTPIEAIYFATANFYTMSFMKNFSVKTTYSLPLLRNNPLVSEEFNMQNQFGLSKRKTNEYNYKPTTYENSKVTNDDLKNNPANFLRILDQIEQNKQYSVIDNDIKSSSNSRNIYFEDGERVQVGNNLIEATDSKSNQVTANKIFLNRNKIAENTNACGNLLISINNTIVAIPFQFTPKINEQNISTSYASSKVLNKVGEIQTFTGVSNMKLNLELQYIAMSGPDGILSGEYYEDKNRRSLLKENEFYKFWSQERIDKIMYNLRAIQLPMFVGTSFSPPPLVSVDFGPDSNILKKPIFTNRSQGENKLELYPKCFIVESISINQDLEKPLKLLSNLDTRNSTNQNISDDKKKEILSLLSLMDTSIVCTSFAANISLIEVDANIYKTPPSFEEYWSYSKPYENTQSQDISAILSKKSTTELLKTKERFELVKTKWVKPDETTVQSIKTEMTKIDLKIQTTSESAKTNFEKLIKQQEYSSNFNTLINKIRSISTSGPFEFTFTAEENNKENGKILTSGEGWTVSETTIVYIPLPSADPTKYPTTNEKIYASVNKHQNILVIDANEQSSLTAEAQKNYNQSQQELKNLRNEKAKLNVKLASMGYRIQEKDKERLDFTDV